MSDAASALAGFDTTRWLDISVPLGVGVPEWPGDVPFSCGWTMRRGDGASVNLSSVTMSPHVGTHADAPVHVEDGWPSSESLPLSAFSGDARVVDLTDALGPVTLAILERDGSVLGATRLLLRTGRTMATGSFPLEWPWLEPACVTALCEAGLVLLGVDAPSVDARDSKDLATHHALFAGGAYNLENLDLRAIDAGRYGLVAFPLRVMGLDAAPVRAVLTRR